MGDREQLLKQLLLEENKAIDPNALKSIYAEDFQGVTAKRPDLIIYKPDYGDIISGPFINPLLPDSEISKADPLKCEGADDIYKRVVSKYPSLKKVVLPEAVDQAKVISEYKTLDKTCYQMAYSHQDEINVPKKTETNEKIEIPADWASIPRTTQRRSYRHWSKLITWNVKPTKPFLPRACQLGFTREEQEILEISTGKTEYEESISDSGLQIMKYAFYGDVKILPHEFRKKRSDNSLQITNDTKKS